MTRRRSGSLVAGTGSRRPALLVALVVTLLLVALFLAAAATRQLNFDETLALRSGWLAVAGVPAEPHFVMPFTLLVGCLGHAIGDPGVLFVTARAVAAGLALAGLALMLRAPGIPRTTALLAGVVTLSSAYFATHAYEFRYDAAVLLGLLLAFRLLLTPGATASAALGGVIAWLALHHVKGVFFAGFVAVLAVAQVTAAGEGRRRRILAMLAGASGVAAAWALLVALLGLGDEAAGVYESFWRLGVTSERVGVVAALGPALRRDGLWWLAAALTAAFLLWRWLWRRDLPRPAMLALAMAAATCGFLFLHPHPWRYMLALPAPFLGLVIAYGLQRLPRPAATLPALLVLALLAYRPLLGVPLWSPYLEGVARPMAAEVATLRALRQLHRTGDRVIDPAGLAYFVEPCTQQWYLDSLFAPAAAAGAWMQPPPSRARPECEWAVDTYRLGMLPPAEQRQLVRRYVSIGGGLALRRGDPRLRGTLPAELVDRPRLGSYWW